MHVVKIGAVWCSGCLIMKPRWEEIENELPWLETKYLDFDENHDEVSEIEEELDMSFEKLPVFIFYNDEDEVVEIMTGEIAKDKIMEKIEEISEGE